jgi:DNA-directed RNA polymerase II subunit RPB1
VTDGTNLADILVNPKVNAAKTITNNIVEIYETLGIEAVRQALFNEISEVLDTIHVDYRHIAMLVDVQTNKGYVLSIDRHGINRGDIGPLAKCSFEETTDKLIKAGVFAEYDKINGVSANVMLGQIPPAGTGDCEVLMDHEMITKSVKYVPHQHEDEEMEDMCMPEMFKITYTPPVVDPNKPILPRIKNL